MIFDLLCQVSTPKAELPTEWSVWIIGGLISFILMLFGVFKWIIDKTFNKVDSVVEEFKGMHKEATSSLTQINSTLLTHNSKFEIMGNDIRETKYAIQNINCANEEAKPKRKVS